MAVERRNGIFLGVGFAAATCLWWVLGSKPSMPAGTEHSAQSAESRSLRPPDNLWTDGFASSKEGSVSGTSLDPLLVQRLNAMGLGPIDRENITALSSNGTRTLLQIGPGPAAAWTHVRMDPRTGEIVSFVPMGSCRMQIRDGAMVFVENDRVWAYRMGWSRIREIPGTALTPDRRYAVADPQGLDCPYRYPLAEAGLGLEVEPEAGGSSGPSVRTPLVVPVSEPGP
jgi:hypothetical protein